MSRVLVAGIYLAHKPNSAAHIIHELAASCEHDVVQRWIALAPEGRGVFDLPCTSKVVTRMRPKFSLLDEITDDAALFDWVILCDDDVEFSPGFLDTFLRWVDKCDFALAQPARTPDSFIDHPIVQQLPGLSARRTKFVEIGPFVCMRCDAVAQLMPFGEGAGMGWGLDFIWPARMARAGLHVGIVDAAPMAHRLRPPALGYDTRVAQEDMARLMAATPYLTPPEAFTVTEVYV